METAPKKQGGTVKLSAHNLIDKNVYANNEMHYIYMHTMPAFCISLPNLNPASMISKQIIFLTLANKTYGL